MVDNKNMNDEILCQITMAGSTAKDLENTEFEFLLNRGTNFKVLDGGERNVTVSRWITSERAWKDVEETEKYMILEVLK